MWLWNFSMLTSFELEKCINRWYFNVEYGDKFHVHLYWAQKSFINLGSDFSKQHPASNSIRSLYSPRKGKVRGILKGNFLISHLNIVCGYSLDFSQTDWLEKKNIHAMIKWVCKHLHPVKTDQSSFLLSFTRTIIMCPLYGIGSIDATHRHQRLWSGCTYVKSDLSLRWLHVPEDKFSYGAA